LTDLSNPKAAAFFTSLFAVAVPPAAPLWFDVMIVATVVATAGLWYALAAYAIACRPIADAYQKARKAIAYATGTLFTVFGAKLAIDA
jgi:threonine/homoserine/homoserine lactone efflux protein